MIRGDTKTVTANAIATKNTGITTANQALSEFGLPQSTDLDANLLKSLGDTALKATPV